MNTENFNKLKTKYPNIFKSLNEIECSDGWFNLLLNLFNIIETHVNYLDEELKSKIFLTQVKNKFGSLRCYLNNTTPYIDGAIALAELMSTSICAKCGSFKNGFNPRTCFAVNNLCECCFNNKRDSMTKKSLNQKICK